MSLLLETTDGESRIRPEGELDLSGAAELRNALVKAAENPRRRVVLDLEACPSIDLACIQLILAAAHASAHNAKQRLIVKDPLGVFDAITAECGFPVTDLEIGRANE